jgi:glutathione peroxidase
MKSKIASIITGALIMTTGSGCGSTVEGQDQEKTALRFKMKSLSGEEVDLARYAGKVVMIVNVASKCGYTSQYKQLQALHEKYSEQGLAILGFPCNQFLRQEPGSAEEIQQFCQLNYGVTFDMFAKVEVKGKNACEMYRFLTALDTEPKGAGKIGWNFEKFILDRNGFVVARFGAGTKPDAPEVVSIIERELAIEPRNDADATGQQEQEPGQDAAI